MSALSQRRAIQEAIDELQALAKDVRRPRPADWSPEAADERTARRIEQIAQKLERGTSE